MAQDKAIDAAADEAGDEVQFPIPKGYNPPVSAKDGREFSAVASFRIDDDGDKDNKDGPMLCLTKIEGVPVSTEAPDEDEDEEGPETSSDLMRAIAQPEATNASSGMPAAATY